MTVLECIENQICVKHGVNPEQLRSHRREALWQKARWDFMRLARLMGYSLPAIGRQVDRHHTSVLYALRQLKERQRT